MRRYSAGKQWEDLNRRRQEAENQELEAQRAAANQAVRAQVGGLPSLASLNATLPVGRPRYSQDLRSRFLRSQDDVPELEAQEDPPPQYRQQAPLTPPTSDGEVAEMDSNEHIRHLQRDFVQKENKIKELESKVQVEKDKRRRLQAERHEAADAQRRAEDELRKLKRQVENLDQLLDGSIKKQKELESDLDLCRQESRDLKRQLHEERCSYESDIRARETWERQLRQQLEDKTNALENEIGRDRRADWDEESVPEGDVQNAPSRSRKQDRSLAKKAYVSIPKGGNRRALFVLS